MKLDNKILKYRLGIPPFDLYPYRYSLICPQTSNADLAQEILRLWTDQPEAYTVFTEERRLNEPDAIKKLDEIVPKLEEASSVAVQFDTRKGGNRIYWNPKRVGHHTTTDIDSGLTVRLNYTLRAEIGRLSVYYPRNPGEYVYLYLTFSKDGKPSYHHQNQPIMKLDLPEPNAELWKPY